jgi:hypothetical protein
VALEEFRAQLNRGADAVQSAASRLKDGLEAQQARDRLEGELDRLFSELGVLVYQRMSRGEPVEDAVAVRDLVDRIAEVERRLEDVEAA